LVAKIALAEKLFNNQSNAIIISYITYIEILKGVENSKLQDYKKFLTMKFTIKDINLKIADI
jgi:hypothetical protein